MNTQSVSWLYRKFCFLFVIGIIFSLFCISAFGQGWTEDQTELWQMEQIYWESLKNFDLETFRNLLHRRTLPWPGGSYQPTDRMQTVSLIQRWLNYDKIEEFELKPEAIHVVGNVAIVCYEYNWKGKVLSDEGRITHTWLKQKGFWKMLGGMNASYQKLPKHHKTP